MAHEHDWFAEAIRTAFDEFLDLHYRHIRQCEELHQRERQRVRELAIQGLLADPATIDNSPCVHHFIDGLCPKPLAEVLRGHSVPPKHLTGDAAAAAVETMDRQATMRRRDLPASDRDRMVAEDRKAVEAGTHARFEWRFTLSRTSDLLPPPDPHSLERDANGQLAECSRFTEGERRTIYLYHLGGLADHDSIEPIVPRPVEVDGKRTDFVAWTAWESRLHQPVDPDENSEFLGALTGTGQFTIDIAEQMLAAVKQWVRHEDEQHARSASELSTTAHEDSPHPSMLLSSALTELSMECWNSHPIRDLAARRVELKEARLKALNDAAAIASKRATEKTREGMSGLEALKELEPVFELASMPATRKESSTLISSFRQILQRCRKGCDKAVVAIRLGGASALDTATAPGTSQRSLEIGLKIKEAERALSALDIGLANPEWDISEEAARLKELGEWFGRVRLELGVALDLSELTRPSSLSTDRDGLSGHTRAGNHDVSEGSPATPIAARAKDTPIIAHADDFTWVVLKDTRYTFSPGNQAESVRHLWASWERSGRRDGCGLSEKTIGEKIGSSNNNFRLLHVFRDHAAWGTLIRSTGDRGVFALYLSPESPLAHTS